MLRQRLMDDLKAAMKSREQRAVSTLRLIMAALKDRDIAARSRGGNDGVDEARLVERLRQMGRARQESVALYRQGNRPELGAQEEGEIAIIEGFMPQKLSDAETQGAIDAAVKELGAQTLKDMGRVMTLLKERYSGRMDFGQVGPQVKQRLS